MNRTLHCGLLTAAVFAACFVPEARAGSVSGNIDTTITIGTGCSVSNGTLNGGQNQFGSVDFGEHALLVNNIDADAAAATGGGPIQVTCSLALGYAVGIDYGQHASGNQRRMALGVLDSIDYGLFKDPARTQPWGPIGSGSEMLGLVALATAFDVPIHGRVPPQGVSGIKVPGVYTDTVVMTVAW